MEVAEKGVRVSLLTAGEVAGRLKISLRKLWLMVSEKQLPAAVKLGKRCTRWRESEIDRYIEAL